jgi:hypothetical protein
MQLSNQALGAVMLALQKSLMEQSDIVPVLQGFVLTETEEGLIVENPPILEIDDEEPEETEENA